MMRFPPRIARMLRPKALRISCLHSLGRLMQAELDALTKALGQSRASGMRNRWWFQDLHQA